MIYLLLFPLAILNAGLVLLIGLVSVGAAALEMFWATLTAGLPHRWRS